MPKLKKIAPYVVLAFLLAVPTALSVHFYSSWHSLKQNPQQQIDQDTTALIDEVSKLIVLPSDEKPTIATVTDPDQLKTQAFFSHATVGDKVLIYTSAGKAILYSPSAHKIVEVAPINLGNSAPSTPAPAPVVAGASTENTDEPTP